VSGGYSTHPVSVLKVFRFIAALQVPKTLFEAHSCKKERNGPLSAKQGLSTAEPSHSLAFITIQLTHPPPPIPPFQLMQNLSLKVITGNDTVKLDQSLT